MLDGNKPAQIEMIGLGEFAGRMHVCPNTVRNWMRTNKLQEGRHYLHIGNLYRFPWSVEFVEQLLHSLAPELPPSRPRLNSRRTNRARLKFRA